MARTDEPDLFAQNTQLALFAEAAPAYRPDPQKVRARLHRILAQARAAKEVPWEPTRASLYRPIFPQMALFLPEGEGSQMCLEFEAELTRLEAV